MSHIVRGLLAAFLLIGVLAGPAAAQTDTGEAAPQVTIDKRKLLVQPRNADGSVQITSFWEDPVLWARDQQLAFSGAMRKSLREIKTGAPLAAAWTLMLLSFGYGVFHAAGPGHGKAVISAWLLATENELRRGVFIAFISAIIQALTAIIIVSVLLLAVASAGAAARDVAGVLESASYGLIGVMGLYLVWTALRPKARAHREHPKASHHRRHQSAHHFEIVQPLVPAHDHVHDANCGCGHAHVPDAREVKGDWSLTKAFSLAFAVGIRPCSGAIVVLAAANALGLYWAGVASTFAMAVGTFITVSVIATLAVYSKQLALRLASKDDRWLNWLAFGMRLGGGAVIAGLGAILFLGSLGSNNTMM